MKDQLRSKLHTYLIENNPDLIVQLEQESKLADYLRQKIESVEETIGRMQEEGAPAFIIEEICLDTLTADLKPSRFNYICTLLQEEHQALYEKMQEYGTLTYEVINMLESCRPLFESTGFSIVTEESTELKKAVNAEINQYLSNKS